MSSTSTCDNPLCSCEPCGCDSCKCGAARLGDLERRVMEIVWGSPESEVTGREVADALPEYAYTTVATVLDRLAHKEILRRRMVGRTVRFSSSGSKGAYTAVLMHQALAQDSNPLAALRRFAEGLSDSEIAALRQVLERPAR